MTTLVEENLHGAGSERQCEHGPPWHFVVRSLTAARMQSERPIHLCCDHHLIAFGHQVLTPETETEEEGDEVLMIRRKGGGT